MKKGLEYIQGSTKRSLDIIGAAALLSVLAPVGAAAAVGVCIDTKDFNPIFPQVRNGEGGKQFNALKLRTIARTLTEGVPAQVLGTFDPRASAYGLALRKYGLDEVPQIVNVFRGEMSLVGMRPLSDEGLNLFQESDPKLFDDWYGYFTASKPGLAVPELYL
ncbi:MAG TPA: sugar transferase [Candidatus Saccharimonadales bacterium]|nr:sugar transferase [Candidatus Saccharimonadales bacterium]